MLNSTEAYHIGRKNADSAVTKPEDEANPGSAEPAGKDARHSGASIAGGKLPSSPSASGPAGASIEGHVGAQYLLPLVSGGEARGLPGVVITQVQFQRSSLGNPMDDVIVIGRDARGRAATLELQVKRRMSFTAGDPDFARVVAMACSAAVKPEFESTRYELAVAIGQTSMTIEQHVKVVLQWARDYQDASTFFRRLDQRGAADKSMGKFVEALRGHMRVAGAPHEDAGVFRLLKRFQVLPFDVHSPGSVCALLARDRCAALLASDQVARAGELWDALATIALEVDASGGSLDSDEVRRRITSERTFRLAGDRRLQQARDRIGELTRSALYDIGKEVAGVRIDRADRISVALLALEQGRYLEIRGPGGVGKSGVLRDLAEQILVEARAIVLSPSRVPQGGWLALQSKLGCQASAQEFLADLAGDGGATLFVDGIDRIDDEGRQSTIADLIRAAAGVPGVRVIATARSDYHPDARGWLEQALHGLGRAPQVLIEDLSVDEVAQLRAGNPALAALLQPGHPAANLVNNLYRLRRLARTTASGASVPYSEAQMAYQWWESGDSAESTGRRDRQRLLQVLAFHSLTSSEPIDARAYPADAIGSLIGSGTVRDRLLDRVEFTHDVLRDWAIGCLLYEEPARIAALPLTAPAPMRLVRGVELAARLHAERSQDATAWRTLLARVSVPGAHGSWRRAVLLAPARSEQARQLLDRCLPELSASNAALLSELVRAAVAVDSQPLTLLYSAFGLDVRKLTSDYVGPSGPAWMNLAFWSLEARDRLPPEAIPDFVNLYGRWCGAFLGRDALSPRLVKRLHEWLVAVEAENHPRDLRSLHHVPGAPRLSMSNSQESDLRMTFLTWCALQPEAAESYLRGVTTHRNNHAIFRGLIPFIGTAAKAAPAALADLFLKALPQGDKEDRDREAFSYWNYEYYPASPTRRPFFDLLEADAEQGLRLVRGVVSYALKRKTGRRQPETNTITIPFREGPRSFPWWQTYTWSRDQENHVVACALMALEAWGHLRIERGDPVDAVIADVLGPAPSPAAYLLVAIDLLLSHWPKTRNVLWPFAASADLVALDQNRYFQDLSARGFGTLWVRPEPGGSVSLDSLRRRASRRTALDAVLDDYGQHGPADIRAAMQAALSRQAQELGAPELDSRGMSDPKFVAANALNRLNPENQVKVGSDADGVPIVRYVSPPEEEAFVRAISARAMQDQNEFLLYAHVTKGIEEHCVSDALLGQALAWATGPDNSSLGDLEPENVERARWAVAALVMRDGAPELQAQHAAWAHSELVEAAARQPERTGHVKTLQYNAASIAAIGLLAGHRSRVFRDLKDLLELAARPDTGMAAVLRAELKAGRALQPELIRSLIRLGFSSAIYAVAQRDDLDFAVDKDWRPRREAMEEARKEAERVKTRTAVDAELRWLGAKGAEPAWPELPEPDPPKARHRFQFGDMEYDTQLARPPRIYAFAEAAGADWLLCAADFWAKQDPILLSGLVRHCWGWTAAANAVGADPNEEPGERAMSWNSAYFRVSLEAAVGVQPTAVEELVLNPLSELPEERFFDAGTAVCQHLDRLWLEAGRVDQALVARVRERIAERLVETRAWQWLRRDKSHGVAWHLADIVSGMFMAYHEMGHGPRCYVSPPGAQSAYTLLPLLTRLTEEAAPSTFVALAFLGFIDIEPSLVSVPFVARTVTCWWTAREADTEFWIDYGVGRRIYAWVGKLLESGLDGHDPVLIQQLIQILDTLVRAGIPDTRALEERLLGRQSTPSV